MAKLAWEILRQWKIPPGTNTNGEFDEQAFENCLSLKDVYFQCDEPPSVGLQAFYNCPINLKIFYPEGNEDLWGTLWHGYKALTWNPDLPQGTPTRRGPLEQILKIFK